MAIDRGCSVLWPSWRFDGQIKTKARGPVTGLEPGGNVKVRTRLVWQINMGQDNLKIVETVAKIRGRIRLSGLLQ